MKWRPKIFIQNLDWILEFGKAHHSLLRRGKLTGVKCLLQTFRTNFPASGFTPRRLSRQVISPFHASRSRPGAPPRALVTSQGKPHSSQPAGAKVGRLSTPHHHAPVLGTQHTQQTTSHHKRGWMVISSPSPKSNCNLPPEGGSLDSKQFPNRSAQEWGDRPHGARIPTLDSHPRIPT